MGERVTDLIIETRTTEVELDELVRSLPGAQSVVQGSGDARGGRYRVRVFGDVGWVKFAFVNQGYGTIVGEEVVSDG